MSLSSNEEVLTTFLLALIVVVEGPTKGYSVVVEVADGIFEVSADLRFVFPLLLG